MADANIRQLQRLVAQNDVSLLPSLIRASLRADTPQEVDSFVELFEGIDPYLVWEWKTRRNDLAVAQNELPDVDFDIKTYYTAQDAMHENLGQDWSNSISEDLDYVPFKEGDLRRHLRRFYFSNGYGVSIVYQPADPWPGDARAINTDLPHRMEVVPILVDGPFPQDGPTSQRGNYPATTVFSGFYPTYPATEHRWSYRDRYTTRLDIDDTQGLIDMMLEVASWPAA
jgi:hypothetical protein